MTSITETEQNVLVSVAGTGALEAAHLKAVLDAIEASQVIAPTYLFDNVFLQLRSNNVLGEDDAALIKAAIAAAAAGTPISGVGDTAERTRAAVRRLGSVLPGATVEALVALVFT